MLVRRDEGGVVRPVLLGIEEEVGVHRLDRIGLGIGLLDEANDRFDIWARQLIGHRPIVPDACQEGLAPVR